MRIALAILGCMALAGCMDGRQVNAGARVPVFEGCSRQDLAQIQPSATAIGLFRYAPEAIFLSGFLTTTARVFVHEFVHLAEHRLEMAGDMAGARVVRHAFRDLCAPGFELGHDDLMTELP